MLQNICSARLRINQLRLFAEATTPTVIALTETHLNNTDHDLALEINDYQLLRQDRSFGEKGGLALYILSTVPAKILPQFCHCKPEYELLVAEVTVSNKDLILCLVYRTNHCAVVNGNLINILEKLADALEEVSDYNNDVCILGDFNLPNSSQRDTFQGLVGSLGVVNYINTATHKLGSVLDLVLAGPELVASTFVEETVISTDHLTICGAFAPDFFDTQQEVTVEKIKIPPQTINVTEFGWLYDQLRQTVWQLGCARGIEWTWCAFLYVIQAILLHVSTPRKTIVDKKSRPRFSGPLKHLKNKRSQLLQEYKCTATINKPALSLRIRELDRSITEKITADRDKNVQTMTSLLNSGQQNKFWELAKQNFATVNKRCIQVLLKTEDGVVKGAVNVCKVLKEKFGKNFTATDRQYIGRRHIGWPSIKFTTSMLSANMEKGKKEASQYLMSRSVLKTIFPTIVSDMSHLAQQSFYRGIFPHVGKCALMIPVPKGDGDYRPISLLSPLFSVVYEKPLYAFLQQHAIKNKIFPPNQYGFVQKMSTEHAIFDLQKRLLNAQTLNAAGVICVNLDVRKAFDQILHPSICDALEYFEVPADVIRAVNSWLTNRRAVINNGGIYSDAFAVGSGVPQGSCLGPLLFVYALAYAMRVVDNAEQHMIFYADDTSVVVPIFSQGDIDLVSRLVQSYSCALEKIGLKINVDKSAVMRFELSPKIFQQYNSNIILNGTPLPVKSEARFLGLLLDSGLSFGSHAQEMRKSCIKIIYYIRRLFGRKIKDNKAASLLFNAYVGSKLKYAIAFSKPYRKCDTKSLDQLIRRFSRWLCGRNTGLGYAARLHKLGWLNYEQTAEVELIMFIVRLFYRGNEKLCEFVKPSCGTELRRPHLLRPKRLGRFKSEHYGRLAPYRGAKLFNEFTASLSAEEFSDFLERRLSLKRVREAAVEFIINSVSVE